MACHVLISMLIFFNFLPRLKLSFWFILEVEIVPNYKRVIANLGVGHKIRTLYWTPSVIVT